MATKQIIGDVRVYSRHSADCQHVDDAAHLKCNCPKWMQYQMNGKPVKESAGTRTIVGLKAAAERKTRELRGEVVEPLPTSAVTVAQALKDWQALRTSENLSNQKASPLSRRLLEWCEKNGVTYLHQITTDKLISFRTTLPYQAHTSSSLKIHWSLIGNFFILQTALGKIAKNPMPDTRVLKQFRIKVRKPEVVPPTKEEIQRVLDTAAGTTKLFVLTMRFTGMAIRDCSELRRSQLEGNVIKGNRRKTQKRFRVKIPVFLADALRALPGGECFFCSAPLVVGNHGAKGSMPQSTNCMQIWGRKLRKLFVTAKVTMTPHKFRHFFITEQLSNGRKLEEVSKMVGTSEAEIKKTYEHWVKDTDDMLDEAQNDTWARLGLDENGNTKITVQ
jgi:integrase